MANDTSQEPSWLTPKAGMTIAYNADSEALRIFVSLFSGLAIYNGLELVIILFMTFRKRHGLYFWALLVSSIGVIPYSLGFLLKYLNIAVHGPSKWAPMVLLTVGWYPMIIGQALVLWSRLHLIIFGVKGARVINATKWMIICTSILFLPPTTVLTFGSNNDIRQHEFTIAYNVMEKIQMFGFCVQETVLSSIYIVETVKLLRTSLRPDTRATMRQLVTINVIIILMDLSLLGLECASLYILETILKGVIYSIKLKLEFAILGKLVKFVRARPNIDLRRTPDFGFMYTTRNGTTDDTNRSTLKDKGDVESADYAAMGRVNTEITNPYRSRQSSAVTSHRKVSRGMEWEYDMARFEHIEDVSTLADASSTKSPTPPAREVEESSGVT